MDYIAGSRLTERTISGFPLSIGTSLAFESVFMPTLAPYDPNRVIPSRVKILDYQTLWINITTLFRNIVGAVDKQAFLNATIEELASTIEDELNVLNNLLSVEGKGLCRPSYYWSTYEEVERISVKGFMMRHPTTDGQRYYDSKLKAVLKLLDKRSEEYIAFKGGVVPKTRDRSLIFTHQPYDLVKFSQFDKLDLIESHTGVLKSRSAWNTKYAPMAGQSFSNLPFHRKLLLVMGDKNLIKPFGELRKEVLVTAERGMWTPATTEDKVVFDFSRFCLNPYAVAVFKSL